MSMKKKPSYKQKYSIGIAIFAVLTVVFAILCSMAGNATGVDIYVAPELTPFGGVVTRDYMRIVSDKIEYSVSEPIVLDASCAFYESIDEYQLDKLCFDIASCEYVDVSISVGELQNYPGTIDDFLFNGHEVNPYFYDLFYAETEDCTTEQLTLKKGFLGQINKNSLQYHFNVTIQVKLDAPENFSGEVYIRVYDGRTGSLANIGRSYVIVKFRKTGDTVELLSR